MGFLADLKRRSVIRVGVAYVVTGWILIEVADLLLENAGAPDWVVNAFTILIFLGFPLALIFAWAFELTPDGLKRASELPADYVAPATSQKLNYFIIGGLAIALGYFMFTHDWGGDGGGRRVADTGVKTVAVLPFVNMSDDAANEFFSDGMTEELLNLLAKIDGLRVTSRTSAFAFKGETDIGIRDIAEKLGVDHIVEGSVRKAGDQLRVTAQLIEVATDSHLWSETYDRRLEDVFAVQSEISGSIADALEVELVGGGTGVHRPVDNLEAYQLYLRGRYLWQLRGADNLWQAETLFKQAIELEPDFAQAWAGLAAVYNVIASYTTLTRREMDPKTAAALERALELDPNLPDALAVQASLNGTQYGWVDAERGFKRAMELDPGNSNTRMWYALQIVDAGRTSYAFDFLLETIERDPMHALAAHWLSDVYRNMDDLEASKAEGLRSIQLGYDGAAVGPYVAELRWGNMEEAIEHLEHALPSYGSDPTLAREWVTAITSGENLQAALESAEEMNAPGWLYFEFPDADVVFDKLNEEADSGGITIMMFRLWEPWFADLRQHPRFVELAKRLNLIEYWNEFGWPDLCRPTEDSFTCR